MCPPPGGDLFLQSPPPDQGWGLINRQGCQYYVREKTLNSFIGMRSYQQVRRILSEASEELSVLDGLAE